MFAVICLVIVCAIIVVYWAHSISSCVIQQEHGNRDYTRKVVKANGLSFPDTRNLLQDSAPEPEELQSIYRSLESDYRLLTFLLTHAATPDAGVPNFGEWLWRLDFVILRVCYALTSRISPVLARRALLDMSAVVGQLAAATGQRCAPAARA